MNLATVLTRTSARLPDRVALRLGEATLALLASSTTPARVWPPSWRPTRSASANVWG